MKKRNIAIIIFLVVLLLIILCLNQFYGWFIFQNGDFDKTYVSLRFDDGFKSQLNAYDLIKEYNFTGSMYIIDSFLGKSGYMNWSDVERVSEIMEIGGHTQTHADLDIVGNYEEEILDNYNTLKNKGFDSASFVYPYGNYNKNVVNFVKKYYSCASTQDVGINTKKSDAYLLKDFTIRSRNEMQDVKRVIRQNAWIILTFHDVGEPEGNFSVYERVALENNAISVDFFEQILQYLKDNQIKVITVKEGCEMLKIN